jgi:hypothetical protein
MKRYEVVITDDAFEDIDRLSSDLFYRSMSERITTNFIKGLIAEINKLALHGSALAPCQNKSIIQEFGSFVKRMNYKYVSVIFTVYSDYVIVLSVRPQASITGI